MDGMCKATEHGIGGTLPLPREYCEDPDRVSALQSVRSENARSETIRQATRRVTTASQDQASKKELMDRYDEPTPSISSRPVHMGPDSFRKALEERKVQLQDEIDNLNHQARRHQLELRMVLAACSQFDDNSEQATVSASGF